MMIMPQSALTNQRRWVRMKEKQEKKKKKEKAKERQSSNVFKAVLWKP